MFRLTCKIVQGRMQLKSCQVVQSLMNLLNSEKILCKLEISQITLATSKVEPLNQVVFLHLQ
uniref:Uncharacterized protein n=1 Tax=Arundo donax TaxID=35708 RepID=A0A0A9CMP4_ARUDO